MTPPSPAEPTSCPVSDAESGVDTLIAEIQFRRPDADVSKIRRAYEVAEKAHRSVRRETGEPYITHPVAVAKILAELEMDDASICAALLHDTLEDTNVSEAQIRNEFGEEVLALVDGVTKLQKDDASGQSARERAAAKSVRTAETMRKMMLAMANDIRVMVIKLADRLHNISTLGSSHLEKQIRVATETLAVYAPLAARLGIWQIKWQLEDLSFKILHPDEYQRISDQLGQTRAQREAKLKEVIDRIRQKCEEKEIKIVDLRGRPKHLFSIHNKMVQQRLEFSEIHDLIALRIICENVADCYVALSAVNEAYVPIQSMFFDYIARPKANGYQSLHTKVMGPDGQPVEIQIRTREMHQIAEYGVAAHWTYKEGGGKLDEVRRLQRLRQQLQEAAADATVSGDFMRTMSTDVFSEQVYVSTPKGDVIELPVGATPVDFAFRVHTNLGLTLIGAKINGVMAPLSTKLRNGDVVELITRANATPSMDWLEFVKSAHTRSKLRNYFRKLSKNDDALRGKDALERELRSQGLDPKLFLGEEKLRLIADQIESCESGQDVLAKIGAGLLSAQNVTQKLRGTVPELPTPDRIEVTKTNTGKLTIVGGRTDNIKVERARCCDPIPGDDVVGYVSRSRGIMIHRQACPNAQAFREMEPERLMPYAWPTDGNTYPVSLRIKSVNRQGLLADVSAIFGEAKANVSAATVKTLSNGTAEIFATIDVRDTEHLASIITKISNFTDVLSVLRIANKPGKT